MTEDFQSPFLLAKRLEADVLRLVSRLDVSSLSQEEQQKISTLKHSLIDARLEIQDYELAETREDQLRNAADSKKYLLAARGIITSGSLYVFGAVDVAHLTAQIEQINDRLR